MKEKINKSLFLLAFVLISTTILYAVPTNPVPIVITQPNGKMVTAIPHGDEYIYWYESLDGYTLLFNKTGYLSYAQLDANGNLQPTDYIATDIENRDIVINYFLNTIEKNLFYSDTQVSVKLKIRQIEDEALRAQKGEKKIEGDYKAICAFVEFSDKKMIKDMDEFEGLFNEEGYTLNGAVGSVHDYFKEISYGNLRLTIKLCGVYESLQSSTYYKDDARELARWLALKVAAEPDIDFKDFDSNKNGKVDGFHFIYAGTAVNGKTIWPHKWELLSPVAQSADGPKIQVYSCSNELNSGTNITTIGVICHEMTHAICGAPDYYDTNYEIDGQFDGTGNWDLMAGGNYNGNPSGACPAHPNIKIKIDCGWVTPVTLNSRVTISNMPNSAENPVAYQINTNTYREYYLLENRQKVKFDSKVPGEGLLIYHVHSNQSDYCINCKHPQRMYPVSARRTKKMPESNPSTYRPINSTYCLFPQHYKLDGDSIHKVQFSDFTTPAMWAWNNSKLGKPISNIKNENGLVSFDFMDPEVGIEELFLCSSDLQITPNPANEYIELQITNYALNQIQGRITKIDFYNMFGQMVKSVPYQGEYNGEIITQRISITDLSKGIYLIKVGNETAKLVVQ